jgi:hypothetical protein
MVGCDGFDFATQRSELPESRSYLHFGDIGVLSVLSAEGVCAGFERLRAASARQLFNSKKKDFEDAISCSIYTY